ncbi:CinA family protein [Crateriforma conspicua]|uniref:Nicotinamide-nucleotide amidohydrolase PncC n=1 Tax=Crateriforma conspicua TaxID=2527996 RepID=A0A5C6FLY8_9PLAN|nr:CinA family protein [Crateriforma conspicua]TWU63170.1 Nicotinamide-nucleotide amidohydrolase PncC [Crateriforma conspicua]
MTPELTRDCQTVADRLRATGHRLVLAESCTCGLLAASIAAVPGVSQHFCGSAVTYREQTKVQWLEVDPDLLSRHSAVSAPVTDQMARAVMRRTDEATVSLAVTGHLGPDAPAELDGRVYLAVCVRSGGPGASRDGRDDPYVVHAHALRLHEQLRVQRQIESAREAWQFLVRVALADI